MNKLRKWYRKTDWYQVFNFGNEAAKARTYMLGALSVESIINGLTTGIFYTGFLMCYGINIINISILTIIPNITSFFTLLTPFILDRFPKRRTLITVTRILYYAIWILGITFLPMVLTDATARIIGLAVVVFLSNAIAHLFSGYSPWHMPYITADIRTTYFSARSLVSNIVTSAVALATSLVTENLSQERQIEVFTVLRLLAFVLAIVDVYLMQKPKEPEYLLSSRPSLLNVIKLPLKNKKFMLTMLICFLHGFVMNASYSMLNGWLLEQVGTGYFYPSLINAFTPLFILLTSRPWSKVMHKLGNFRAFTIFMCIMGVSVIAHSFVDSTNYLWLNTAVITVQHCNSMLGTYATGNFIYLNLPKEDQTCFISFHSIMGCVANLISMSIGTAVAAAMGDSSWVLFGHHFTSIPTLLFFQGFAIIGVGLFAWAIRKYAEPEGRNM